MGPFISLFGMAALVGVGVLLSTDRRAIQVRTVASAFGLLVFVAGLVLFLPFGKTLLSTFGAGVQWVINYSYEGISFLFGDLATDKVGFIFALRILPIIIFFSALMAVLYHLGIMQWVVRIIGGIFQRVIGTRRVESFCAAANIFVSQAEAPLVVRPYIATISNAQLFTIMVTGMSTVAGSMLAGYAAMGIRIEYLIAASVMAAPSGLMMAKLLYPESPGAGGPGEEDDFVEDDEERAANVVAAVADGAMKGTRIAVNVGAMLIAFIALLSLLNGLFGLVGSLFGFDGLTFEGVLGWVFSPIAWLMGVPWSEAQVVGNLVGKKTILNEFVAYVDFVQIKDTLSEHSQAVVTFALCGFANIASIAVLVGSLGAIAPNRRSDAARVGMRAVAAATLANLMNATLASFFLALGQSVGQSVG
ncbi:MAG: NupC/NupG family nucleoside CNT transporter [Xanthomonadales bacterium]|nr:NupC/NupG family nucleoside CNT transporter [Xanthomonadales bacterium]